MRKWFAGPALAGLLLLGTATVAEAQETQQAQENQGNEDDNSNAGLLGLLGLAGLAGLAGLKRRDQDNRNRQGGGSQSQNR